jgi:RHS repeat-associated protein
MGFGHVNALGSDTQGTEYNGAVTRDALFYPWGQFWVSQGLFASFSDVDMGTINVDVGRARNYNYIQGRWISPDPDNASAQPSDPQTWNVYAYARNNPATLTDPTGEDYRICVHDETNQNRLCTVYESEEPFLQTLKNPGPGITVQGNELSGTIYGTDVNGNRVEAGTYEQVPGHGMEDHGLEHDVAADMAIGGLLSAGLRVGVAAIDWATSGLRNLLGLGAQEATTQVASRLAGATVDQVVIKASSTVGNQSVQVASEDVAKQAADQFLGPGAKPIYANRGAGPEAGWKSADGARVVLDTHVDAQGVHMNFINKTTGGNLHVRW